MPKTSRSQHEIKVLFIGNSFTARNDLPGLIATIAKANGKRLVHRLVSIGGASLRAHWNKGDAVAAIRSGAYDYVVLQEQSTLPIKNAKRMHENIRLFDAVIKVSGGKTALYLTWARRHAPDSQQVITDEFNTIGKELDATLIPAGVAWQRFLRRYDYPVLHDRDGSHPTIAGSYLAACVASIAMFAATVFPEPTALDALTVKHKKTLERVAAGTIGE